MIIGETLSSNCPRGTKIYKIPQENLALLILIKPEGIR
jgi:hypothetical protein